MTRPSLAEDASPDAFAQAMVMCQGYSPSCSDQNECAHGGECFTSDSQARIAARKVIKALVDAEQNSLKQYWLGVALHAIDQQA